MTLEPAALQWANRFRLLLIRELRQFLHQVAKRLEVLRARSSPDAEGRTERNEHLHLRRRQNAGTATGIRGRGIPERDRRIAEDEGQSFGPHNGPVEREDHAAHEGALLKKELD